MMKKNIIIDCDPGHDDVMALLLALANQETFNVLGVTTVAGNQTLEKVTLNLKKIYTYLGFKTPFAKGSSKPITRELFLGDEVHGETGLDGFEFPKPNVVEDDDGAVLFMYKKIMSCKEKVTLIPVGPLTNIGLLLATFPEVIPHIEMISLMGGSINAGNTTPYAEFNIYVDPEAAKIVFKSGIPIVMSGLEVTHNAGIKDLEIDYLKKQNGKVSKMCGELLYFYVRYHHAEGYASFPLHDVCSVMYLLHPEIFKSIDAQIEIDCTEGMNRGRTAIDNREWVKYKNPNTKVLLDVDRDKFIKYLFEGFEKLDKRVK